MFVEQNSESNTDWGSFDDFQDSSSQFEEFESAKVSPPPMIVQDPPQPAVITESKKVTSAFYHNSIFLGFF